MRFDVEHAKKFFRFLNHEKFTELRLIDPTDGLKRQFFLDNLEDFLRICEKFSGKYNVYVGVNERKSKGGKAENVGKLSIIPLDIDPIRPKGTASTKEELEFAHKKMEEIRNWLKEKFECEAFIVMSGNGYHLHIKIPGIILDEFNRDSIQAKVKAFIHEIQRKFNNEKVRIDSTFDLPRVMKVPGTLSVKGNNTPERPWRMCTIVEANDKPCRKIREYLVQIKTEGTKEEFKFGTKTMNDFTALLKKDQKFKDVFEGKWRKHGFPTRSEAEQSILTKLVFYGFSGDTIHAIMSQSKIGKWQEKTGAYRNMSIRKAVEFVKKHKKPFEGGKTQEVKRTCGEDLQDKVFEQIRGEQGILRFQKISHGERYWYCRHGDNYHYIARMEDIDELFNPQDYKEKTKQMKLF